MNPLHHPRRTRRTRHLLLGLTLAAVIFSAACSDDDGGDALADTESIDSTGSGTGNGEGDGEGGGSESNATEGSEGSEVLGTARATLPSAGSETVPLRLDVVRLERHDDLVELTVNLVNEAPVPTGDEDPLDYSPSSSFGGGPGVDARYDVSDIGLVDSSNQKLYLAIIDSEDECVCTVGTGAVNVQPGETWTMTATIGGVPDDVEQLDVRVPGFPNVTGITLR